MSEPAFSAVPEGDTVEPIALTREAIDCAIADVKELAAHPKLREEAFGWLIGMGTAQDRFYETLKAIAKSVDLKLAQQLSEDMKTAYFFAATAVKMHGVDGAAARLEELVANADATVALSGGKVIKA